MCDLEEYGKCSPNLIIAFSECAQTASPVLLSQLEKRPFVYYCEISTQISAPKSISTKTNVNSEYVFSRFKQNSLHPSEENTIYRAILLFRVLGFIDLL